jgi:hypothetical protein
MEKGASINLVVKVIRDIFSGKNAHVSCPKLDLDSWAVIAAERRGKTVEQPTRGLGDPFLTNESLKLSAYFPLTKA